MNCQKLGLEQVGSEDLGTGSWRTHPGQKSVLCGGRGLLDGRGCEEDGGVGLTLVSYLRGAGVAGLGEAGTSAAATAGAA